MYFGPTANVDGSLTGQYLKGQRKIPAAGQRRSPEPGRWLTIRGAAENNLKKIDVRIPLGLFVCLTGVSGSGKSTLINQTLYPILSASFHNSKAVPLPYQDIDGLDGIDKVIEIDQAPIGRTPRAQKVAASTRAPPTRANRPIPAALPTL